MTPLEPINGECRCVACGWTYQSATLILHECPGQPLGEYGPPKHLARIPKAQPCPHRGEQVGTSPCSCPSVKDVPVYRCGKHRFCAARTVKWTDVDAGEIPVHVCVTCDVEPN